MAILNWHHDGRPRSAVSIMRPSKFGNPYMIGRDGDRKAVIALYAEWLISQLRRGEITVEALAALHGRDLLCCCKPLPCHGEVLEIAAAWAHETLTRRTA